MMTNAGEVNLLYTKSCNQRSYFYHGMSLRLPQGTPIGPNYSHLPFSLQFAFCGRYALPPFISLTDSGLKVAQISLISRFLIRRAGKKVHAWTVDEESTMVRMLRAGVDGMITSVPALLQHVMSTERQQCALNGFS